MESLRHACKSRSSVVCRLLSRRRFDVFQHLALTPGDVHHHAVLAVDAHQDIVVLPLQPALSHDLALRILGILRSVQSCSLTSPT